MNPDFIFKDFEILYDNAIILIMEMDKDAIASGPSAECVKEIIRTYVELGVVVNRIADFLRERGYNCHPSPAIGGDINTVPTAQDANLGCMGKNGILVTPDYGPCLRIAAVFIDAENLPMAQGNDHMWIADFCETCNRVRMSVDGTIFTCLGQEHNFELRPLLRAGISDDELEQAIRHAINLKPLKHEFNENPEKVLRFMSYTGG